MNIFTLIDCFAQLNAISLMNKLDTSRTEGSEIDSSEKWFFVIKTLSQ